MRWISKEGMGEKKIGMPGWRLAQWLYRGCLSFLESNVYCAVYHYSYVWQHRARHRANHHNHDVREGV